MEWRDRIQPDQFQHDDGITRAEIIANIEDAHWSDECDAMTCPLCQEERDEDGLY